MLKSGMSLSFDPKTISTCRIMTQTKDANVVLIEVSFKDGTSRTFQGEDLTEELIDFARKMSDSPAI
jgi:hypothetical protein